MENTKHRIRSAKQSITNYTRKISDDEIYLGFIGRGDAAKTVLVPNKPGYVYIRIPKKISSGEITEYSEHIAISKNEYRHNAPVKVVKRKDNPSQFEVKELWIAGMGVASAESIMGSVTNHHWNHELYARSGGHDPIMIDEAQIKNLQVTPTSPPSSKVIVGSGWYIWKDRTVHWYNGTLLELASDVPSGTNAENYVNIWFNPETDVIHKEINSTITLPGFGTTIQNLVEWPSEDYIPLACVRLEAGVYQIDWSNGKVPNIINMRPMHSMMPGDMLPAIHPLNPPEGYHSGSLDSIYIRETDPSGTYQYDNLHDILEKELGPERARVKVSSDDTTPDFLENKIVSAGGVSISTLNPGANEQLQLFASGTGGSALTVEEIDGSPSVSNVDTIRFPSGTLTDDGGGQVTVSNIIDNYLFDAKGDLITARGDNLPTRLPVSGVDGEVLAADSTAYQGLSWKKRATAALDNLASTAVNADVNPNSNNARKLGTAALKWSQIAAILAIMAEGSSPGTPAANDINIYADTSHNVRQVDETGQNTLHHKGDYDNNTGYSSSASEVAISTTTIKANSLGTGGHLIILASGYMQNNNFGSAQNATIRVRVGGTGGTLVANSGAISVANNAILAWCIVGITYNVGSTSAQGNEYLLLYRVGPTSTFATATSTIAMSFSNADTTADQDIVITTQLI